VTAKQLLVTLAEEGTEQNKKVYRTHGVAGDLYGVSFSALKKMKADIGTDHKLAKSLWKTGVHDARVFACMIADPEKMTAADMDAWVKDLDNYIVCDAFSGLVARSGDGMAKFKAWKSRKTEYVSAAAWNVLHTLAMENEGADITAAFAADQIKAIEETIKDQPNRTKHSMNQALIWLGLSSPASAKKAVAASKRIGKVQVDHGKTNCQTPDAGTSINKTMAQRARAAEKARRAK
jgi:3-methyladenine DNA glycosylase AlkD